MHESLYPRDYTERHYMSGREGSSIDDSVDASMRKIDDYIKRSKQGLIIAARNSNGNKDKQKNNNQETEIWKKKTVEIFQETTWFHERRPKHGLQRETFNAK